MLEEEVGDDLELRFGSIAEDNSTWETRTALRSLSGNSSAVFACTFKQHPNPKTYSNCFPSTTFSQQPNIYWWWYGITWTRKAMSTTRVVITPQTSPRTPLATVEEPMSTSICNKKTRPWLLFYRWNVIKQTQSRKKFILLST